MMDTYVRRRKKETQQSGSSGSRSDVTVSVSHNEDKERGGKKKERGWKGSEEGAYLLKN